MSLTIELHHKICKRIRNLRSIERLISTPEFADFYDNLDDKEYIRKLIEDEDKQAIYNWIKKHNTLRIAQTKMLRFQARDRGIRNWYNLSFKELNETLQDTNG